MQYLLDTVTIIRHFCDSGKIGDTAKKILNTDSADHTFYISVISLMEILYLSEKNRIKIDLSGALEKISSSSLYSIVDLTPEIIKIAGSIKFHDRMILATALWLNVPILSIDEKFKDLKRFQ